MVKHIKFIWPVVILLVAVSCKKKDYPDPVVENDPQFYFKGTVNGVNTDLEAGLNNYYMYTSYAQNANQVYQFSGNLKPYNCSNCINGIEIIVNDMRVSPMNAPTYIDSALVPADYPYLKGGTAGTTKTMVGFVGSFNQSATTPTTTTFFPLWNFGDGTTSTLTVVQHIYTKLGKKQISLTMSDAGCSSTVNGNFVARPMGDSCLWSSVQGTIIGNDSLSFTGQISGAPPVYYAWDFGDGNTTAATTSTSSTISQMHHYNSTGSYTVKLMVTDAKGDTTYAYYNANTQTTSACTANYSIQYMYPMANPYGFSNIEIRWTDASGTVYTSNNANQPASSYFEILSVENYKNNENGQSTKRLHVRFKCMVYNGGVGILIDNAEAYIAVAYK